ncbi:MAG: ABC transporter permease, partial [Terriglobales bacterium]
MLPDLRHALRQLRKSPLFTATAVLTLALGIGATTAIFTLVQNVLFRTLPVASPHQLYRIGDTGDCCVNGGFPGHDGDFDIFSYALYKHLEAVSKPQFTSLAAVFAGEGRWPVRRGATFAASLYGQLVSGNFFSTLGIHAFAGRLLTPSDDRPGAAPVAVISYAGWQSEFGSDRRIIGSTISIEAHPFNVVGIAPPGFYGDRVSATPPDIWVPLAAQPVIWGQTDAAATLLNLPGSNWLYPIGRIRPGTNIKALQAKLSAALRHWLASQPRYT